jgi:hypothetical protein
MCSLGVVICCFVVTVATGNEVVSEGEGCVMNVTHAIDDEYPH